MKKIAIFLVVVIIIVTCISYIYLNYKIDYNSTKNKNLQYNQYYEQEIQGTELSTLLNRAVDDNVKNKVEKDKNGYYIDNENNSIKIDIKFTDDDSVRKLEEIYASGIDIFVAYYSSIKFKCTKIDYHQLTNRVRYLYFEQISE